MSEFMQTVKSLLKSSRLNELRTTLCSEKDSRNELCDNLLDLLAEIVAYLKLNPSSAECTICFGDIFCHLSRKAKPKELLLGVLEHLDPMIELEIIELLLPALQHVCRRLIKCDTAHICYNLGMSYSSLVYYAESLNLPKYADYDPLSDSQDNLEEMKICRFVETCTEIGLVTISDFLKPEMGVRESDLHNVTSEALMFCCGLLHILSQINLDQNSTPKLEDCDSGGAQHQSDFASPDGRKVEKNTSAEKLTQITSMLHSPWKLMRDLTWRSLVDRTKSMASPELEKIPAARACFLYLLFVKNFQVDRIPQVVSVDFALQCCLPSILYLLQSTNPTSIHKGMELCRYATNRIEPLTLRCRELQDKLRDGHVASNLLQNAARLAVHCPSRTLRQRSVQFVTKFLDKFVWRDRFDLLYDLLGTQQHSGMIGCLVTYFKDKLAQILQEPCPEDGGCFLNHPKTEEMYDLILALPNGSETDLLAEHDRLMSALNLLRFLFIRDVRNQTKIWNRANWIEKSFLDSLVTGLNLSRMHMRDELKKCDKEHHAPVTEESEEAIPEITIQGMDLPPLPPHNRKAVFQSAIYSFDMMQGVCARVQQLIDQRPPR